MVTGLECSDHDLAGHRVLIFNCLAFVKSLPHHENGVAVEAVLELYVGELTHRYTHRILQVLLLQVLNLEFLLIDGALILETRSFLPVAVDEVARDWIRTILLLKAIVDADEVLVLSVLEGNRLKNLVKSSINILVERAHNERRSHVPHALLTLSSSES